MKLENRFTVPVPRDEAWKVLLDVERIAPCLPGAKVLSHDGDSFTGQVKVKLGPINLTYGGKAQFVELDEANGIAVIDASGKETRGTGTAKATITCRLIDKGASTDIEVDTDLAITGKPAQFGRGVLADVSAKLVDQFAACLSEEIQEGTPSGGRPVRRARCLVRCRSAAPGRDDRAAGRRAPAPRTARRPSAPRTRWSPRTRRRPRRPPSRRPPLLPRHRRCGCGRSGRRAAGTRCRAPQARASRPRRSTCSTPPGCRSPSGSSRSLVALAVLALVVRALRR